MTRTLPGRWRYVPVYRSEAGPIIPGHNADCEILPRMWLLLTRLATQNFNMCLHHLSTYRACLTSRNGIANVVRCLSLDIFPTTRTRLAPCNAHMVGKLTHLQYHKPLYQSNKTIARSLKGEIIMHLSIVRSHMSQAFYEPGTPQRCSNCNKEPAEGVELMRCARCKCARYCSKPCQAADWKQHQRYCKRFLRIVKQICHPTCTGEKQQPLKLPTSTKGPWLQQGSTHVPGSM